MNGPLLDKNLSKDFEFQNLEHSHVNGDVKVMVLEDENSFIPLNKNNNPNNVNNSIPSIKSTKTSVVIDLNEKTLESTMTYKDQDNTHISYHSSKNDTKVDGRTKKQKESTQNNYFPCQICDKRFKNEKLRNAHLKLHNEKTKTCELCFKKFHFIATLKRHQRVHTG